MNDLFFLINKHNIKIKSILHIGSNYCQEQTQYITLVSSDKIHWVEADPKIVYEVKKQSPSLNIYQSLITDVDDTIVNFNIANNNGLSSSILELGIHSKSHPTIVYINSKPLITTTLDSFIKNCKFRIILG